MTDLVRYWGVAENDESIELAVRPHLVPELLERWPPIGLERRESPSGVVRLSRGLSDEWVILPDSDESGGNPSEAAWNQLEQTLTAFAVQRLAHLVAVHAAVIAWKNKVIIVPAASGAGKSTLAIAAARAGAAVLSDEYALIDPVTANARGWRRPIYVEDAEGRPSRHDVAIDSEPLQVGLVAAVAYSAAHGNDWAPMKGAEAVGELLTNCVTAVLRPSESMDAALAVCRTSPAIKGTRGDAALAVREILSQID